MAAKLVRGMRRLDDFDWESEKIQKIIDSDFKNVDKIMAHIEKLPYRYKFQKQFLDWMVVKHAICKRLAECPTFEDRDKLIDFLRGIKDTPPINGCDYRPFSLSSFKKFWDTEIDAVIYLHERELYDFYRPKRSRYADYNKSSATLIWS